MKTSEAVADLLTEAVMGPAGFDVSEHDQRIFRESLLALIRLAKAEQVLEMQNDFNKLTTQP